MSNQSRNVVTLGRDADTGRKQLWFQCPGCRETHRIPVSTRPGEPNCWEWNGDLVLPTIKPSAKSTWNDGSTNVTCHFFLREGVIEFCNDCTHDRRGKKVPLPVCEL